jgi:hypothetical protein
MDCSFERTNQTALLNDPDIPDVINGIRTVCGATSSTLSNVTESNNETVPTSTPSSAAMSIVRPSATAPAALLGLISGGVIFGVSSILL